jgi:NTE family protein
MPKIQPDEPISLMFVGGGARYPAFIGALQAIEEKGLRISKVVGLAAGSIVGALYASGMSPEELYREALQLDTQQFRDFSLLSLVRNYGVYRGKRLERWIDEKLEGKRFSDTLRFPMQIVATDLLKYRPVVFSAEKFPDVTLAAAAASSSAVPWVFGYRDMTYRGQRYALVDGSLMSGIVERGLGQSGKTLILKVASKRTLNHPHHYKLSLRNYFVDILRFGMHAQEKEFMKGGKWKDTILLYCADISPARFRLSQREISYLYTQGYEQTMTYLKYKWGV